MNTLYHHELGGVVAGQSTRPFLVFLMLERARVETLAASRRKSTYRLNSIGLRGVEDKGADERGSRPEQLVQLANLLFPRIPVRGPGSTFHPMQAFGMPVAADHSIGSLLSIIPPECGKAVRPSPMPPALIMHTAERATRTAARENGLLNAVP
jgi:hypothetical protein